MSQIRFFIDASVMRSHNAAYVMNGEDPREALVEQVVSSISTDVAVKVGDVTMHLAAWMDPDHWESDWREAGVEDVDALLAEAVTETS